MVELEGLERLKELGLTEYEIRVYGALLKLGSAKGGEAAKRSGVPHGKTYMALLQLADKGLVTVMPLKPKIFTVVEPQLGVKRLLEARITKMRELEKELAPALTARPKPSEAKAIEKLEVSAGFREQFELCSELMRNARSKYLAYSRGEKVPASFWRDIKQAQKRGIDFRLIVYEYNDNRQEVHTFVKAGVPTRYYPRGEFTFVIRDSEEMIIVIKNPRDHEDRVVLHFSEPAFARAIAEYFETIWKKAEPIRL